MTTTTRIRSSACSRLILLLVLVLALTAGLNGRTTGFAAGPANPGEVVTVDSCNHNVTPGINVCFAERRTDRAITAFTPTHAGYSPANLRAAYNLPTSTTTATVAIIDAYDNPNVESDLAVYRSDYGLPACTTANGCFSKLNQNGAASPLPAPDAGWASEIALDVSMVSAICPSCHITLVEANSASSSDLFPAVRTAVNAGAKYVSMSWGGSESGFSPFYDANYLNAPGVVYTASSGDSGYGVSYPASSANVVSVGGTRLLPAVNARGWTESVWNTAPGDGAGSGCSSVIAKPSWQGIVPNTTCSHRAVADVSAVADPGTGVSVYLTYPAYGWTVFGGTSASAPIIAAVYALAGTPGAQDQPAAYPYAHPANLNDVSTGSNGSCAGSSLCTAGVGWDGPTGLGTPWGTTAFAATPAPVTPPVPTPAPPVPTPPVPTPAPPVPSPVPVPPVPTPVPPVPVPPVPVPPAPAHSVTISPIQPLRTYAGRPIALRIAAQDSYADAGLSYVSSGLPRGVSLNRASGVISGAPARAGNYRIAVGVGDKFGAYASTTFNWVVLANVVTVARPANRVSALNSAQVLRITAHDSTAGLPLHYVAAGLPTGLRLDPRTGYIRGTTSRVGAFRVSVTVWDDTAAVGVTTFGWTVRR